MKKGNLIFGIRPLMEAIEAGKEIEKVMVQQGGRGALNAELRQLLARHSIPVQTVPLEKLNSITRQNHQGVIAFVSPISFGNIDNIIAETFEMGRVPKLLMLDGITDVRNFGAICRTAECLGVDAVIIPDKGTAQINEEAIKTSAGALYNIPVCRVKSLGRTLEQLQQSGIKMVACSEKKDVELKDVDMTVPVCIIMGSEENGISNELLRKADEMAKIPMVGKTSSLNVSVAAGMALYELNRQRSMH